MSESGQVGSTARWWQRLTAVQVALAAALVAIFLLPGLGSSGLLDPWEMDRAAVARRIAGSKQVLVIDRDGDLLKALEEGVGAGFSLRRIDGSGRPAARAAMAGAAGELRQQITHAMVLDMDAVADGRTGAALDPVAGQINDVVQHNRGIAVLVVAPEADHEGLQAAIATSLARRHRAVMQGGWWRHAVPQASAAAELAPLFSDGWVWTTPERIVQTLRDNCPSPWQRIQHKVDGFAVQSPWLDTVAVAASLAVFGSSETAARLPGALIGLFIAMLLFVALRRLRGSRAGWLAALVYATLPLTLGHARLVTLEQSAALGVTLVGLGLALGVARRGLWWGLWVTAGLAVLLLGRGLGGLSMGAAMTVGVVLTVGIRRPKLWATAVAALVGLGVIAWVVLTDDQSTILRGFRFTRVPFAGGLPTDQRDFSALVGQMGFGLYPWGPIFLLGMGRLLFESPAHGQPDDGVGPTLAMAFGAPLLVGMGLLPGFHHVAAPVAPMVAAITGLLLVDLLAGKVSGTLAALLVAVPALLLHREGGKQASALLSFVAFDPPFGADRSGQIWPGELGLPRTLRALVLLSVLAFCVGLSRPMTKLRSTLTHLQGAAAAGWALAGLAIVWALDAVISLGTRVDVLLGAKAARTGYHYDRVWTTIQGTRPEVVAAATLFTVCLAAAIAIALGRQRGWRPRGLVAGLRAVASIAARPALALLLVGAAAVGVLLSGAMVAVDVRAMGWGEALLSGLGSAAFLLPIATAAAVTALTLAARLGAARMAVLDPTRPGLWSRLLASITTAPGLSIGLLVLVGLGGVGVGASQLAGTWSYGYLAASWCLVVAIGLVIGGRCDGQLAAWATAGVGVAITAWGTIFMVLSARYLGEGEDGLRYIARLLLTAPDAALLLALMVGVGLNRLALQRPIVEVFRAWSLWLIGMVERPRWAVALLSVAGILLSAGYAWTLLPGLSLHFSQKHLVTRVAEAGGAGADEDGLPRTYKYVAGGRGGVQNNFYTQSMPTIGDRDAVLRLLAGRNVATRVTDFGPTGGSASLTIPGWRAVNDANADGLRDVPGWFGIAAQSDGVRVVAQPAVGQEKVGWQPGAWKGARLHGSGRPVEVAENDSNTLTLVAPGNLVAGDLRRGAFSLDKATRRGADPHASAAKAITRFVVLPKTLLSGLNHLYRKANDGRHIALLDARSSRLVLAATTLTDEQPDQNWLRKPILDDSAFAALEGVAKVSVDFDGKLELVGWNLDRPAVQRSQKYLLNLYFRVHKPVSRSYMLFMHPHPLHRDLWPHDWHTGGKQDAKRCTGCLQTDHWLPGDIVHFPVEQEVPLGTNSGGHDIILGWYDPLTDKRLPVGDVRGEGVVRHGDNRITIGRLQVR